MPVKGWDGGKGELGLTIETALLPDAWVHEPLPERRVLVLAYGCFVETPGRMALSTRLWDRSDWTRWVR